MKVEVELSKGKLTVCCNCRIRLSAALCCWRWRRCLLSWLLRCCTQSVSAWGLGLP